MSRPDDTVADGLCASIGENFERVRLLYDVGMPDNNIVHDLIYPAVFGPSEYIGQFSDNSASEIAAMGEAMKLPPEARVLDVGCGTGAIACFLARRLCLRVVGIDISAASMRKARRRIEARGLSDRVRLVEGNVYTYPFGTTFDGVYGTGSFCHFDAGRLFTRCRALLRRSGTLGFMERVRLAPMTVEEWARLTTAWACPSVYSVDEYTSLLRQAGFVLREVHDLNATFRTWQERSVLVREELRDQIVELTSPEYHRLSLELASYENEMTQAGKCGYARFVAEAI